MKIAILSDIHGNAEALKQTLAQVRKQDVERLIVLGDIIGYYYAARDVVDQLKEWSLDAIRGNHERMFGEALQNQEIARSYRENYGSALDVARATLPEKDVNWLLQLPDRQRVNYDGLVIDLCHGSFRNMDEYVYPDSSAEVLEACRLSGSDYVLMGHTHYPFIVAADGSVLLNPGSVGQARDRGGFSSWCLFDTITQAVVFERTPYDTRSLVLEATARDAHLPYLREVLERGN